LIFNLLFLIRKNIKTKCFFERRCRRYRKCQDISRYIDGKIQKIQYSLWYNFDLHAQHATNYYITLNFQFYLLSRKRHNTVQNCTVSGTPLYILHRNNFCSVFHHNSIKNVISVYNTDNNCKNNNQTVNLIVAHHCEQDDNAIIWCATCDTICSA
jgi:hypothetical protein